ncbi:hypothetical protein D3C87_1253440 [compost metagenome]
MWQRGGDAIEHTLDVDVDHPVPLIRAPLSHGCNRHQAGVVDHHVDTAELFDSGCDERLHLRLYRDIGGNGQRFTTGGTNFFGNHLQTLFTPRCQYDLGAASGQVTGGAFTQSAAGASDNHNFAADVVAHVDLLTPGKEQNDFCMARSMEKSFSEMNGIDRISEFQKKEQSHAQSHRTAPHILLRRRIWQLSRSGQCFGHLTAGRDPRDQGAGRYVWRALVPSQHPPGTDQRVR